MKCLSALVFSVALFNSINAKAADIKPLTAEDFKAAEAKKLKPLTAADLKAGDKSRAPSADEIANGTAQEQCIKKLELGNADYSYKFVKSNSELEYEIIEIPKEKKAGSYIRYYSAGGYAEINSGTAACNHNNQKKDVKAKFLDVFKTADEEVSKLQVETDKRIATFNKDGSSYVSGLNTFRSVCARAFPMIHDYLANAKQLPQSPKTTGATDCSSPSSSVPCPVGRTK